MMPLDPRPSEPLSPGQPRLPKQSTQPLEPIVSTPDQPQFQGQETMPFTPPPGQPEPVSAPAPAPAPMPMPGQPAAPPAPYFQAAPPPPGPVGASNMAAAPATGPGPVAGIYSNPDASKPAAGARSFLQAFRPEPSKAPPLEWLALGVGLVLALSSLLPWITGPDNSSISGLDSSKGSGEGLVVLGAGLASVVMGFIGLSRDSIALAAGQAIIGLITLIFALLNLNPGEGYSTGPGVYLALVASLVLIGLSLFNAYDAFRKGARY